MSDFLSRVASRAVGQAATARPRLPALFEPAEPAASEIEPAETGLAAPRPPTRIEEARPPAEAVAAPEPERAVVERPAPDGEPEPPVRAARLRREEGATPRPRAHEPARPADRLVRETLREPETVRELETVAAIPAGPAAPAAAPGRPPAAAVAASPARPAAEAVAPPAPPDEAAARAETPAVRVHIGRLEVRASLHEAPALQPRQIADRAPVEELSLADYLRGRKAAR